jgi:ABC-type multidrug transport system fused ATPase/permease subunit
MDEVTEVAKAVGAHPFISKLNDGYQSQWGNRQ